MIKAIICLTCLYYAVANLHALWNVPNAAHTMADDRYTDSDFEPENKMSKRIIPTAHLNGTDEGTLCKQYENVLEALRAAQLAVMQAAPNGRDYYPQDAFAIGNALAQHNRRVRTLYNLTIEVEADYNAFVESTGR
jgi:hypothetical protein